MTSPSAAAHDTVTTVLTLFPPHVTVTGQLPGVVLVPTVQLHDTAPLPSVRFGPSPCAVPGPFR